MNTIFHQDYPIAVEPESTPRPLVKKKKTWRDSLPIDMLLSSVSVLVVAQSSSEIPEGLMNTLYINHSGFECKQLTWVVMGFASTLIRRTAKM